MNMTRTIKNVGEAGTPTVIGEGTYTFGSYSKREVDPFFDTSRLVRSTDLLGHVNPKSLKEEE